MRRMGMGLASMQQIVGGTSVHKRWYVISSWLQVKEVMEVRRRNIAIPPLLFKPQCHIVLYVS
jgi:hypothetical protein